MTQQTKLSETVEPRALKVSDCLFHFAERWPEKEFLIFGERRITYQAAAREVQSLSRALLASGVRAGDRVATFANPQPDAVLTFLAAVDIGAIWLGLNPKYTRGELEFIVQDCAPKVIFGVLNHQGPTGRDDLREGFGAPDSTTRVTLDGTAPGMVPLDSFRASGETVSDEYLRAAQSKVRRRDAAVLVYTSGTTGRPKGAVLSHESLIWSFSRQGGRWGGSALRIILNLPINHVGGIGDIFCSALTVGGTVLLMERFEPDRMLELIPRERINALMQIPTMYQILTSRPNFASADLSSLRTVVWGGAALPKPVLAKLRAPGRSLSVMYGQTEAPCSITYSRPDTSVEDLTSTIGRPDPDLELRIADAEDRPLPVGSPGEIQVRHESMFLGYFRNPAATEEALTTDGFLRTGDMAVVRQDGSWQLVGRIKEMFKSGGYNVYPREIEQTLEEHPAVSMAVVVSRPHEIYAEVGHAFVVPGQTIPDVEELTAWCHDRLANYKVPKDIMVTDSLPMLPIGKPDRRALADAAREFHDQAGSHRTENA